MGRREAKAAQTRDRILRAARTLFGGQGFVDTSMESVAAAAEIGTSTLYRYFPTKDALLLGLLGSSIQLLADEVAAAPDEEDLAPVLGRGIAAVLAVEDRDTDRTLRLRALIDESPVARAALWDEIASQERRLTQVIADRTREAAPPYVAMATARLAISIVQIAADMWRSNVSAASSMTIASDMVRALGAGVIVLPAMTDEAGAPL